MLYLLLNLFTLAAPVGMSFEKKIHFFSRWKNALIAIILMWILFIPWDIWFTANDIWGFNPDYLVGVDIVNLPLEEWLFFLTVPFASLFIYENVKFFVKSTFNVKWLAYGLAVTLIALSAYFYGNWYTSLTFLLAAVFLVINAHKNWFSLFSIAYLIVLIPFLIVNGALTGFFTESPVVWYSSDHIIGFRLGTIPIEDTMYNLLMMGLVVWFYELLNTNETSTHAQ